MVDETLESNNPDVARHVERLSDVQKDAYLIVVANPGITITGLAGHLNCSHSTATHHLNTLAYLRLVTREREGRTVHHYAAHHSRDNTVRFRALLAQGRNLEVLRAVQEHNKDAPSINKLATHLEMPFNSLKVILNNMETEGLIKVERKRGRYRIQLQPAFRNALAIADELEETLVTA